MALQSIEKKKAEIEAARRGMMNAPSGGKQVVIRVRTGLLVGGIALIALEFAMAFVTREDGPHNFTAFAYLGVLMILAWIVVLFAGMFVK